MKDGVVSKLDRRHDGTINECTYENTDDDASQKSESHPPEPVRKFSRPDECTSDCHQRRADQRALPWKLDALRWWTVPEEDHLHGSTEDAASKSTAHRPSSQA